jgi:hypothetical protein
MICAGSELSCVAAHNRKLQIEEKNMPMTRPQPINSLLVAGVSAAVHAGTAVLALPFLSVLLLTQGAAPVQMKSVFAAADDGMVFAVITPLAAGIIGFLAGGFMAMAYNAFVASHPVRVLETRRLARVRAASLGNVA